jgi:hypothetical protein
MVCKTTPRTQNKVVIQGTVAEKGFWWSMCGTEKDT